MKIKILEDIKLVIIELKEYLVFLKTYFQKRLYSGFQRFEFTKDILVGSLVAKRGKYVRPFLHTSMSGLFLVGLMVAPIIKSAISQGSNQDSFSVPTVLGTSTLEDSTTTQISVKPRDSIVSYFVEKGDTISTISSKFGVSEETIMWQNNLEKDTIIKPGMKLEIPPVSGMVHKVKRGDSIYTIAKKYSVDAQVIVDWPFNSFSNDETFELAVGQLVVVPDGIKPKEEVTDFLARRRLTPSAGAVSALGQFVWPVSGGLTQYFSWYHPALDIANNASPDVLASDSGTVISVISQKFAYGNHIIVDHGNGYQTLYAHLANFYVTQGQTVKRGDSIGKMGSTGRSTGIHLHFEIRKDGASQNPLNFLK